MLHRSEDLHTLARLLDALFEAGEIRRFAAATPDSGDLEHHVPGAAATLAETTLAIVKALDARGLLDHDFFARLHGARPRRRTEIDGVAARFTAVAADDPSPRAPATIERQELRALLRHHLPTDADLEAFAHDTFPQVAQRWSAGMDRLQKTTLLLNCVDVTTVHAKLLAYTAAIRK
jgi:hypothetical protein